MGLLDKYGVAPSATDTFPTPSNAGAGLLQKYGVTPEAPVKSRYASTRGALASKTVESIEGSSFGLIQTTLEGLAKVGAVTPELRDRFTSWAADKTKEHEEGDPRVPGAKTAGDVLGQGLVFAIEGKGLEKIPGAIKAGSSFIGRLLTSVGIGAGTGATQFIPPDSDETRLHGAEVGAAGGAVLGAATEPLRAFGTKLINKQFIKQATDIYQNFVKGYDQNARTTAQSFQMGFGRINLERQRLNSTRDTLGDRIFPTVDASAESNALIDLKAGTVNKSAKGVIQQTLDALGTPKGMESYAGAAPGDFSPSARAQIGKQLATTGPPINYSRIVKIADDLEAKLKAAKPGEAKDALESAKEIVDGLLGKLEKSSPQLRAASRQADTYEKNVYQSVARDEFKDLRKEGITPGDFHDANKKAVDIATGDNPKLATDLYNTLTPSGRESLKQGIVYRALDQAMDAKTKVIDPDKVATFLRAGSVKSFFPNPQDQQVLKGLENLTHVGSKWAFTSHAPGASLMLWGGYHAMAGHVEAGMSEAAIGAASLLLAHNAASILRTQSGINFLRAVGKMNPDSPAAVRAFNSFMTVGVGAVGGGTNASEQAFGAFGQ